MTNEATIETLRAALHDIATSAHCTAKAGPSMTPNLGVAWLKFAKISLTAERALAATHAATHGTNKEEIPHLEETVQATISKLDPKTDGERVTLYNILLGAFTSFFVTCCTPVLETLQQIDKDRRAAEA